MHTTRHLESAVAAVPVTTYAYDLLVLAGRDVRGLALVDRKALLARVVPRTGALRYCDHVDRDGKAFLAAACEAGLEGVVAKRVDSPYRAGRSPDWRKIKCHCRQEFVVGGYTAPKGTRAHFGALHLGVYDGEALVYVGRVGSGLGDATLDALARRIRELTIERAPFTRGDPPHGAGHYWVKPELICEVRFTEWTPEGRLRHPVFLGFRSDRTAATVEREKAAPGTMRRRRRRSHS
jgi:bifunctional non-homologous end joining protein LigD